MSENRVPSITIRREITEEGLGKLTFTLSEVILAHFLSEAGATAPSDISEEVLRRILSPGAYVVAYGYA